MFKLTKHNVSFSSCVDLNKTKSNCLPCDLCDRFERHQITTTCRREIIRRNVDRLLKYSCQHLLMNEQVSSCFTFALFTQQEFYNFNLVIDVAVNYICDHLSQRTADLLLQSDPTDGDTVNGYLVAAIAAGFAAFVINSGSHHLKWIWKADSSLLDLAHSINNGTRLVDTLAAKDVIHSKVIRRVKVTKDIRVRIISAIREQSTSQTSVPGDENVRFWDNSSLTSVTPVQVIFEV